MNIRQENPNSVIIGQKYPTTWWSNYSWWLPSTLNHHKNVLFGCSGWQAVRVTEVVYTLREPATLLRYAYVAYLV